MKVVQMKPVVASIRFKNIAFATDLSPICMAALPFVTALARRYESKVYLTHVLTTEPYYPIISPEPMGGVLEQVSENAERQLTGLSNSEQFDGIPHEVLLEQGDLSRTLSRMIKDHEIDLLVI